MTGSLQEKLQGGTSFYYVVLSYKLNGKWKTKWVPTHLKVQQGNKKKAKAMISDIIDAYSYLEEKAKVDVNITLCDYVDVFLELQKNRVKGEKIEQSTYDGFETSAKHIKHYFGIENKKVVDIRAKDIRDFYEYQSLYGKLNKKTNERGPLAIRTIRSHKSFLYALFTQARIDGLSKDDPTSGISVGQKKSNAFYGNNEFGFMTQDEALEMLEYIRKVDEPFFMVALLGVFYGLRRSEMSGLKWEHIDFEKNQIKIRNAIVRIKIRYEKGVKTTSSYRTLVLLPQVKDELLALKQRQEQNAKLFGNNYEYNDYVLKWDDGHQFTLDYLSKHFSRLAKEFGRDDITLHKLRHTCCSILAIDDNWPIKEVQFWLGHSDIQTTLNIYTHAKKYRGVEDLTTFSNMLGKLYNDKNNENAKGDIYYE